MNVIWKYPLRGNRVGVIQMPIGAVVRYFDVQNGEPTMWVEVDPNALSEPRRFDVYGTGHSLAAPAGLTPRYVGSWQVPPFVWHLYELVSA